MVASYNLRSSGNKLAIPLPRTNYYKYSFSYSVSVPGNCLPSAQASNISNYFPRLFINCDTAFMKNRL